MMSFLVVATILCNIIHSLGPRTYTTGEVSLTNPGLTVEINVTAGYSINTMNGVSIRLVGTGPNDPNTWIGIGFNNQMDFAPALTCTGAASSLIERQLGRMDGGSAQQPQLGAGMCDLSLPQFVWEMPGYDYHGLYTFVPDLVDIPIIYARGSSAIFAYHQTGRAITMVSLSNCIGECDASVPATNEPTNSPSNMPSVLPSKAPSQSPSKAPSQSPSKAPSQSPTKVPTKTPTGTPTASPLIAPTESPIINASQTTTAPLTTEMINQTTTMNLTTAMETTTAQVTTTMNEITTTMIELGKTYIGSAILDVNTGLQVNITINIGYDSSSPITNGVTVALSNNNNDYSSWIGIGINSLNMPGTSAIICSNNLATTVERRLGQFASGTIITPSQGTGTCDINTNGAMYWFSTNFNGDFIFPTNGDDLDIIWAFGATTTTFGYHNSNRGSTTISFKCDNCDIDLDNVSKIDTHTIWFGIIISLALIIF